jgi:hypothetical protein
MIAILIGMAVAAVSSAQSEPAGSGAQVENTTTLDVHQAAREGEVPKSEAEAFIARCGSRKFETEVISDNRGKARKAKILLCAKPKESDEHWIATLEKAATQIEASPELSATAKSKVIGELQAAISQVLSQKGASLITQDKAQAGVTGGPQSEQLAIVPVSPALKPNPMPRPEPLVATVPPLPQSPALGRVRAIQPQVSKPRLSISCPPAGEPGAVTPCSDLAADTLLVIRADEDLKTRVSLRFVRDGDPRGGIALGMMRRGQIVRTRLPARVCAGVVRGRVEMQTVVTDPHSRAELVADTQGPFRLHC